MASGGKRKLKELPNENQNSNYENGHASLQKAPASTFEKGAIRRLFFENFVTYSNVEFYPGPHLNVIVGPNGTGKSTIVCGICLGLAGKTGVLGRATSVVDYIKHGHQKAVIEVELHNPGLAPFIIRREITRSSGNNTSAWFVNGQQSSQKNVEELVSTMKIQIGNLCQFLPQDKVSDFAKMTQQELLLNTEKTIDMQLYEDHMSLNKACDKQRTFEQELEKKSERLEREVGHNARLEDDVRVNEERESEREKLEIYKMKRPWVLYEERRMEFEQLKNEKKKVKHKLDSTKLLHEPLKQRCSDVQKQAQQLSQQISNQMTEIRRCSLLGSQALTSLEEIEEKLQEIDQELAAKQQDEANRLHKLKELYKQLSVLKLEMSVLEQQPDVQPEIDRVSEEMRLVNGSMSQVLRQGEGIRQEVTEIVDGQRGLREELGRLQDVSKLRLNNLNRVHRDTYTAVMWLRENKKRFKATIHEPMILTIDVKNPQHAKYVESRIAFRDLRAFICEDGDDLELFVRHLRDEQRLKVNVVMMPQQAADSFQPRFPITQYKRFQFFSYLRELFTCPEPVMRFLCSMYHVHLIPVGNQFTKDLISQVINECSELNIMFTANHEYSTRKSKYTGQISSRSRELRDPNLLTVAGDQQKENNLMHQLQKKQEQQHEKEQGYKQCQGQLKELETKMNQLRDDKKRLFEKKNEKRTLLQKIGVKEDSIKRLDSEAVDLKKEESLASDKKKKVEGKKCEFLQALREHTQRRVNLSMERVRVSLRHVGLVRQSSSMMSEIREKESSLQTLENEFALVSERVEQVKLLAKRLLTDAQSASGIQETENLPDHLQNSFKLLPNTIEEIDTCIHQLQAKIDCMMAVDDSVVRDYHSRKELIATLERDVGTLRKQLEDHKREVDRAKQRWIVPIQLLIDRINVKFSEFFRLMKCAGEVSLKIPDNQEDYEKYGVCVLVKFRDSEQLRELNAFHQSGGERSVSTVLYIMSLQELTVCPFRCVDEINQGMDPINERLVFDLVVKVATRDRASQYFLLTPKLLPDLEYNDNMTVLFVHNGPFLLNHKDWSLKKFLNRRARLTSQHS